jgi:hypothetical protein
VAPRRIGRKGTPVYFQRRNCAHAEAGLSKATVDRHRHSDAEKRRWPAGDAVKISEVKGFTKAEEQKRQAKSAIDKAHYKFYYKPVAHKAEEAYVLLDILFGESGCHKIEELPIESSFLMITEKPSIVTVPSFEDLAGDKLTAFAPETTGIPYVKNEQSASM